MLDFMGSLFQKFGELLTQVLPTSPFQPFIQNVRNVPFLNYLNWFVPIGPCITIMETWLAAILVFYIYSIILRWVKAIGD